MNKNQAAQILGISIDASPEERKKAYRKKAMEFHPDRKETGNEAKFKEIQEAYDYLENPKNKSSFFDDIDVSKYSNMFRQNARKNRFDESKFSSDWSPNETFAIPVTLEEAFNGMQARCNLKFSDGTIENIEYTVPKGVRDNQSLGMQSNGTKSFELKVNIVMKDSSGNQYEGPLTSPLFFETETSRLNSDITTDLLCCPFKMITGGWANVRTLDGTVVRVRIPEGQEALSKLKLRGKGYWRSKDATERGDLYLRLVPTIKKLTEYSTEDLNDIANKIHFETFSRSKQK